MRSRKLLVASLVSLALNQRINAQESYFPTPFGSGVASTLVESQPQYGFATSPSEAAPATIEELTTRLKALEAKEISTESELMKLADAKKALAEKPKFPNVAISGVFQADAVSFSQLESSREAYGNVESGAD